MSLPSVPNVIKVTFGWKVGGDLAADSRHYYRYTGGPPTGADLTTTASNIVSAIPGSLAAIMHPDNSLVLVTVTDLSSMTEPHGEASAAIVGSRTGGPLPAGAAVVLSGQINRRYRGGKPRMYMPWLTSTDLATTLTFLTASATAAESAWGDLTGAVLGAGAGISITDGVNVGYFSGYTLGPPSTGGFRKKIPTPLATPHVDTINSTIARVNVGSQRRRNRNA